MTVMPDLTDQQLAHIWDQTAAQDMAERRTRIADPETSWWRRQWERYAVRTLEGWYARRPVPYRALRRRMNRGDR